MALVKFGQIGAVRIENVTGAKLYDQDEEGGPYSICIDVLGAPGDGQMWFEFEGEENAFLGLDELIQASKDAEV